MTMRFPNMALYIWTYRSFPDFLDTLPDLALSPVRFSSFKPLLSEEI